MIESPAWPSSWFKVIPRREREREREMKVGKADAVFANLATPLGGVYLRSGREGRR